ncbi:unnamed protein product [Caretta caretta]
MLLHVTGFPQMQQKWKIGNWDEIQLYINPIPFCIRHVSIYNEPELSVSFSAWFLHYDGKVQAQQRVHCVSRGKLQYLDEALSIQSCLS